MSTRTAAFVTAFCLCLSWLPASILVAEQGPATRPADEGQPVDTKTIQGQIKSKENQPLERIRVQVMDTSTGKAYAATTDSEGKYRIVGQFSESVTVSLSKGKDLITQLAAVAIKDVGDFTIATTTVEGTLRNSRKEPVANAAIALMPKQGGGALHVTKSDNAGKFKLNLVQSGKYFLMTHGDGKDRFASLEVEVADKNIVQDLFIRSE